MRTPWLLAAACAALTACGDDDGASADAAFADAADPRGRFTLGWSIDDGAAPLACADVNASTISVSAFPEGAAFGMTDALSCTPGAGMTRLLAAGRYDVTIGLVAAEGELAEPVVLRDVVIEPGRDTSLGEVAFTVDATGGFRFQID